MTFANQTAGKTSTSSGTPSSIAQPPGLDSTGVQTQVAGVSTETPARADDASPPESQNRCASIALGWNEVARRIDNQLSMLDRAMQELDESPPEPKRESAVALTVIIPVYNELKTLPVVMQRVEEVMPGDTELIIVDDASTDGTSDWLDQLPRAENRRIIRRRRNHGKGSAVRLGIRHSRGAIVAIQDADLEYDPFDLLDVVRPIRESRAQVAFGSRYLKRSNDPSSLHRLVNWLLTTLSNRMTGLSLTDMETCHKAFQGDLIRSIELRECRFGFEPEVTAKIAARRASIIEVPVNYDARSYAEGKKIGWRDGLAALACLWRYRRC